MSTMEYDDCTMGLVNDTLSYIEERMMVVNSETRHFLCTFTQ
jgi:hypothetical protein